MSNPLIDDIQEAGTMPPVEIALPTRGAFYEEGGILKTGADPDEVVVLPISILDESTIRDPLMMVTGKAVAKLIKRVCPVVDDPGRLCEIDIQAILIACRMASYGPTMKIEHECPECQEKNQIEINLNEHILRFDPYKEEEFKQFEVTLPVVGQQVRLRPMMYEDSIAMTLDVIRASQEIQQYETKDDNTSVLDEDFINAYTKAFLKSLDTNVGALVSSVMTVYTIKGVAVNDRDTIHEWIILLPPKDLKAITSRIALINEAIRERSKIEYECLKCKVTNSIFLELDPQKLFTPAEESETEKSSSAESKPIKKITKRRSRVSQK